MKKTVSAFLAATLFATSLLGLTACNSNKSKKLSKNTITKIEENSEWFDYNETPITLDGYLGIQVASQVIKAGDEYALIINGTYKTDDISTGLITDYGIRDEDTLVELNLDGSIKKCTKISPEMVGLDKRYDCESKALCYYNDDVIGLVGGGFFDEDTYNYSYRYVLYNFTQNKAEDISCVTDELDDGDSLEFATYSKNGYLIATSYGYSGSILFVAKDGELLKTFNLDSVVAGYEYVNIVETKGDIITLECVTSSRNYMNYNIDVNTLTGKAEDSGKEVPMLIYNEWQKDFYDEAGTLVSIQTDGIYRGDKLICDFSESYCNPASLQNGCIVDEDENHYAILVQTNSMVDHKNKINFVTFDKASANPNAGKTILTAGFTGNLEFSVGTAISEFNQTNPDYFVMAKSYTLSEEDKSSVEVAVNQNASTSAILSNKLMMDMLAGEGPDILINTANFAQFNNDDYLMDLSSFIDEEFEDGILFDNVLEASKINGKLYQLPTTFSINGIVMNAKYSNGKSGFTFDEFNAYVSDACNGSNPLSPDGGRIEAFNALYPTMSELMYDKNGNIDMKNGVFEQIASYCMNNIGQKANGFVAPSTTMDGLELKLNSFVTFDCIATYLYAKPMINDIAFTGIPSTDGRGPSITAESSIAISVSCCDEDGAKAFVKSLMTSDKTYEQVIVNPILVSAAREASRKIIEFYNSNFESQLEYSSASELNSVGIYSYDLSLIDSYIDILKSANCTTAADMNIMVIIDEEIQAYFADQKSIDEVSSIIQDRAQIVIDER